MLLPGNISDFAEDAQNMLGAFQDSVSSALDNWRNANIWLITDSDSQIILEFASFLSADVRCESNVVSAPVEEGGFATYNKVVQPISVNVSLAFQGSEEDIQDAVFMLGVLREETILINLVTPDAEYESLTLQSYNYSRKRENGIGVLFVDLSFVEVKQVETQYTNANLAPQKKRGLQQAKYTFKYYENKGNNNSKNQSILFMIFV